MQGIERNPGPEIIRNLTVAHVNINSITSPNRLQELEQFATLNHIDVLALTETKLDDTVHPNMFHLQQFHAPFVHHRNRHGGGTAIYVHKSLPVKRIHTLELSGEEWIWAMVKLKNVCLLVCCIYLPPHPSVQRQQDFIHRLTESTTMAQTFSPTSIIILGDINVGNIFLNMPTNNNSGITSFDVRLKDATDTLDLTQLIDEPTRLDTNTYNLRDLLFTSNTCLVAKSGVLPPFAQLDHYPIYASFKIDSKHSRSQIYTKVWEYDKLDAQLLTDTLLNTDWDTILHGNVDQAAEKFTSVILNAAKEAIPTKTVRQRTLNKPWMTQDILRNIRKRDRLFRIAKQRQRETDWRRWKIQRNFVTDLNRRTKDEYIRAKVNTLLQQKHSPFKYHRPLKDIIGKTSEKCIPPLVDIDGNIVTNDNDKATMLNNHLASQSRLDADDRDTPDMTHDTPPVPTLDHFTITTHEVLNVLNSLDINKSCGPDELPPKILKLTALLICEPLARLFNLSLETGIYPKIWKHANVHPIFKNKGSPSDPTKYRPISILPCLTKVFGKIVFNRIYKHLSFTTYI